MDGEQKKEILARMKLALKDAREERNCTEEILRYHLNAARNGRSPDAEAAISVIEAAKDQNLFELLSPLRRGGYGGLKMQEIELGLVADRERTLKRPSTRALKAHRRREADIGRSI